MNLLMGGVQLAHPNQGQLGPGQPGGGDMGGLPAGPAPDRAGWQATVHYSDWSFWSFWLLEYLN